MTLDDLGDEVVIHLFSFLQPFDLRAMARCSRRMRALGSDEHVWRRLCKRDWVLNTIPVGQTSYSTWADYRRRYGNCAEYYPRAKATWSKIHAAIGEKLPNVVNKLHEGVDGSGFAEKVSALNFAHPVCPALQAIYAMHNGQELKRCCALFGGYAYYDQFTETYFLDLVQAAKFTQNFRDMFPALPPTTFIFAGTNQSKYFGVDVVTGDVELLFDLDQEREQYSSLPAHPRVERSRDGVLRWLEEFARRVETGYYQPHALNPRITHLSLFPTRTGTEPCVSEAVTRGVRVMAAAVFVPERSAVQGDEKRYFFAYRLTMQLRDTEDRPRDLNSCQLTTRHWEIRRGAEVEHVRGEGVIGMYPILTPSDAAPFSYESCTHYPGLPGTMGGELQFVPGTARDPQGQEFNVLVAPWTMVIPAYIY